MLNKYNQRVIAILGTLTIVSLSIIIIIGSIFLVKDLIDSNNDYEWDNGITLEEIKKEGQKMRDQTVTILSPFQLDSAKQIYASPVSQVNLDQYEPINEILNVVNSAGDFNIDSFRGINNIVVHDFKRGTEKLLFKEKTNISEHNVIQVFGKPYLIVIGAQRDTDGNQKLNNNDLQSLFIYDIYEGAMHDFLFEGYGLVRVEVLEDSNHLIAFMRLDKNKNGKISYESEPGTTQLISLNNFESKPMVSRSLVDELQRIVD